MRPMNITLDWLGCATFRLTIGETVVFLDTYMDRVAGAPPVGIHAAEVERADFVLIGHAHFDHLAGAEVIAPATGAKVIGSNETCRVLRTKDVPRGLLFPAQGGERFRLAPGVTVRVFPSLHSCTWISGSLNGNDVQLGHYGLCEDERLALAGSTGLMSTIGRESGAESASAAALREHLATALGSRETGGPLCFLIETPEGSIFYQDTSGCWTGVLQNIRPDVAILAAAGRGNLDGEPIQGSLAQFVAKEADLLRPRRIVLGHHDDWMPPVTHRGGTDTAPIIEELAHVIPTAAVIEEGYMAGTVILGR